MLHRARNTPRVLIRRNFSLQRGNTPLAAYAIPLCRWRTRLLVVVIIGAGGVGFCEGQPLVGVVLLGCLWSILLWRVLRLLGVLLLLLLLGVLLLLLLVWVLELLLLRWLLWGELLICERSFAKLAQVGTTLANGFPLVATYDETVP